MAEVTHISIMLSFPRDALPTAKRLQAAFEEEWNTETGAITGLAVEIHHWYKEPGNPMSVDGTQGAFNERLLAKADYVIALFARDLGAPWRSKQHHRKFASGTVAEIELARQVGKTVRVFAMGTGDDSAGWLSGPPDRQPALRKELHKLELQGLPITEWTDPYQLVHWAKLAFAGDLLEGYVQGVPKGRFQRGPGLPDVPLLPDFPQLVLPPGQTNYSLLGDITHGRALMANYLASHPAQDEPCDDAVTILVDPADRPNIASALADVANRRAIADPDPDGPAVDRPNRLAAALVDDLSTGASPWLLVLHNDHKNIGATPAKLKALPGPIILQAWGGLTAHETLWDQYAETFPKRCDRQTFRAVSVGASDTDSVAKLRLQLASGQDIPDIVQLNYSEVAEFAQAGALADLRDLAEPYMDDITDDAKALMDCGGIFGLPFEVKQKLWFYRTDLFEHAGIDPLVVRTQQQFVDAGHRLQAACPGSYIWNIGPKPPQYQWGMIASGNGARYSTPDPWTIVVGTDKGTANAFQALKDLRSSGVVADIDDFTPAWEAGLADGTIASALSASWLPQFLMRFAPHLAGKWAVTTWPVIGDAEGGSEAGGSVFVIPQRAAHKEQAFRFVASMLMTKKGARAYVKANPSYVPNVIKLLDDPSVINNAYFGASLFMAQREASKQFRIFPYDASASTETLILNEQLRRYLASDDVVPDTYLRAAQDQLDTRFVHRDAISRPSN